MWDDIRVGFSLASNTIIRGNKRTTILTIIILMLIFVNLVFSPAVINGMSDIFTSTVMDYSYGNIIVEPAEDKAYINNAGSLLKKINSVNGVKTSTKRLITGATFEYKANFVGGNIFGIDPEEEILVSKFHTVLREGDFLTRMSRDEVVLGNYIAGEEGGPEILEDLGGVNAGTIINITYSNGVLKEYKVKGIHKGGQEISDTVALVHYKELESILGIEGEDKASNILIKIENMGEEEEIKQKLLGMGIKEDIFTWEEKIQDIIKEVLESFSMLTIITRIVSIIIAVFVLFIVIYINTLYRTKQIGILKAVGITSNSIIFSYILLSFFYTIAGILFGSILLAFIVFYFTQYPIQFYELMYLTPKVEISFILEGVISLFITALIAGFVPSWLVTKKKILEAIWAR